MESENLRGTCLHYRTFASLRIFHSDETGHDFTVTFSCGEDIDLLSGRCVYAIRKDAEESLMEDGRADRTVDSSSCIFSLRLASCVIVSDLQQTNKTACKTRFLSFT